MSSDRPRTAEPSSISSTLLERVRAERPEAWERLVDLYGPVVYGWCRKSGLGPEDAADLVQEVFTAVAEDLGMSVQAVYKARSRVLRRLRQELGDAI